MFDVGNDVWFVLHAVAIVSSNGATITIDGRMFMKVSVKMFGNRAEYSTRVSIARRLPTAMDKGRMDARLPIFSRKY